MYAIFPATDQDLTSNGVNIKKIKSNGVVVEGFFFLLDKYFF
jgi:hypothetical protein